MKEKEPTQEQLKTLAQLQEELDPQGEKVEKADLVGVDLQVEKIKPWVKDGKTNCRVICYRMDTGERVHFNLGEPGWNGISEYVKYVPFVAHLKAVDVGRDDPMWLLE